MNHSSPEGINVFSLRLHGWYRRADFLLGLALLGFFVLWISLSGCPLSIAGFFLLAAYVAGGSFWTLISQLNWPSRSSCLAYYPIGFGISTGFCNLFLLARLGLVYSTLLAMLLGLVSCVIAFRRHRFSLNYRAERNSQLASAALVALGLVLLSLITFLFSSQLHSASTLTSLSGDTTLLAWNDYIAHARTTLEISSASVGVLPQSSLGPELRLAPYHYGHYVLPALLLSQGLSVGSLQAYTGLAPVFGAFLLLAPVFERFRLAGVGRIVEALPFLLVALLTYATWVHFASDTFVDPLWLLVAGPGTMYAAAVLLGFLQIYVSRADSSDARGLLSLLPVVAALFLLYKVHLLHSFFVFLILVGVKLISLNTTKPLTSIRRAWLFRRPNRYLLAAIFGAVLLAVMNLLLKMSRGTIFKDFAANALKFTEYFSGLKFDSYEAMGHNLSALDISYLLACAAFGLLVMVGPLYGIAFLCLRFPSLSDEPRSSGGGLSSLLFALLGSLMIAVFFAPAPAWWPDSSEFQNRVWPVLWCVAFWYMAGLRLQFHSLALRNCLLAFQVFALILTVYILPDSKLLTVAAPTIKNVAYPTVIPLSIKATAARLQVSPSTYRFFASKEPFTSRDNDWYALVLSAASGRLPLYALPNYQLLKGSQTIRASWDAAASRSLSACIQQPTINPAQTRHPRVAIVEGGGTRFAAVCP